MPPENLEGPQKRSERVKAWVYEVINPLYEALRLELHFLENGHITWRFWNGQLEYIRPFQEYLTPPARHNYVDFCRRNPDAAARFVEHDDVLKRLEGAAKTAHEALVAKPSFVKEVEESVESYNRVASTDRARYPSGPIERKDLPQYVAQYLVNELGELPSNHTDGELWAQHRDSFLRFIGDAELETVRKERTVLRDLDRVLQNWLLDKRFALCEQYDIPAAPLTQTMERAGSDERF